MGSVYTWPVIFCFKKKIPFSKKVKFRFIIGKVEFDEITIDGKKTMTLSLVLK